MLTNTKLRMLFVRPWTVFAGLLALLGISGCSSSDSDADLHAYLQQLKKSSKPKAQLLEQFVLRDAYLLKDSALKSPFPKNGSIDAAALSSKPPLQRYSLNALRLLGIIQENGQVSAVIMTPDGKIYPLKQGDLIGTEQGQVIEVNDNNVVVNEVAEHNTSHRVVLYLKG